MVDVAAGAARGEEFLVPGFAGGDDGERRKLRSAAAAAAAGDGVRHAEGEETPEESRETGLGVATLGLALDLGLAFGLGLEEAAVVVALGLAMADSGSPAILPSLRGWKACRRNLKFER